jgi:hypothetical protein
MQLKRSFDHARSIFRSLTMRFALMVVVLSLPQQVHALAVDKEFVLLVDVSNSGLKKTEFDSLMTSYSSALSSTQVLNSIQAGTHGRIAVSLMLYAGPSFQQVGIPWMSISGAADAAQFTALATALNKPNGAGKAGAGAAITTARTSFGTETGGVPNGFESTLQIIDVAAAIIPAAADASVDVSARNGALVSGVDLINILAVGSNATAIANYYSANVIGSSIPGVAAAATTSPSFNASLTTTITSQLGGSITAVPEPSAVFGVCFAACVALLLRRRN